MNDILIVFDMSTIPLYFFGFLTFLTTILDDWINPKKQLKSWKYYLLDFIYTVLSIALGISICYALETSQSICWIVSIIMGLIGSTLIRKIKSKREEICDDVIDSIRKKTKDKIEN